MEEVIKFFETHHKVWMDLSLICIYIVFNFLNNMSNFFLLYHLDSVAR